MSKVLWFAVAVAGTATFFVSSGKADVPAPPVNQYIGFKDGTTSISSEAVCRGCHPGSQANTHHMLYNTGPLPPATLWYSSKSDPNAPDPIPFPDANKDGVRDTKFSCITCHGFNFAINRNCPTCHQRSPHHAKLGNVVDGKNHRCTPCHGSLVSDYDDGHYVPSYAPSLVTPLIKNGTGLPLNSRGKGAGSCEYCHDSDGLTTPVILNNHDTHHMAKFGTFDCSWCHGATRGPAAPYTLRNSPTDPLCENCHSPVSLHAIQVSSGTDHAPSINVGGELAGFGHIGRDNGPGDSDCWGCHGFAMADMPAIGPVVPYINAASKSIVTAGKATSVVLTGAAFTNKSGATVYDSTVTLTAANGTIVSLTPDAIVDQGSLAVTIPATVKPGNYGIKAKKGDLLSNPARVTVVPKVWIGKAAAASGTVTITGGGFSGFQKGAGLYVKGTTSTGTVVTGTVVSWSPAKIVAKFAAAPKSVSVKSVFGNASHAVVSQ